MSGWDPIFRADRADRCSTTCAARSWSRACWKAALTRTSARPSAAVSAGVWIDFRDAFFLATTGGGIALDLPVGHFSPGYQFDAMVIDTTAQNGTIRLWDDLDSGENILQKIIYTASKSNIAKVWIGGRDVSRSPSLK